MTYPTYIYLRDELKRTENASNLQVKRTSVEPGDLDESGFRITHEQIEWFTLTDNELIIVPYTKLRWILMQAFECFSLNINFVRVVLGSSKECYIAVNHFNTSYMRRLD
jgi:hypothetical protein